MKTFSTRPSDVRRHWHVIDATGQPLGRLSTQVATFLRGKHKPIYSPHLDTGDFVIVVNASKIRLTGRKMEQKRYYHHSGYPGGMRTREVKHEMGRRPEWVIERAVKGMLPKGPLGLHLFNHLHVYGGPVHPHAAQVSGPEPEAFVAGAPGSDAPHARRPVSSEAEPVTAQAILAGTTSAPELPAPTAVEELPPPAAIEELPAAQSPEAQA
jgi:large subunit ribosomal protein L13